MKNKTVKTVKMGDSEIVLKYDEKTKLISVLSSALGDVIGSVGGSIYGDIESHIYGNIWGAVRGKVVCVDGNVGKVFGEVVGLKQIESEIKLYNEEQEK